MRNSWEVVVVVTTRRRVRKRLLRQINGKRLSMMVLSHYFA
jgi:hypothetical protein